MAHERMSRHHRRVVATVIVVTQLVVALLTGGGVYAIYKHLDSNITSGDEIDHIVDDAPKGPLNILVMGEDSRSCTGCGIDNESGEGGSDTTILVHISQDRQTAYGISIPRDLLVDRPACTTTNADGTKTKVPAATDQMWNAAYALAGPACTVKQTELLTHVRIDDYITINFGGFKSMVNALGGIQVCLAEPVDDTVAHIHFDAGWQTLNGPQALQYVRERHGIGDGSDIGRMKRQQSFIATMINKAVSAGTLSRPDKMLKFANALSESITTNPELASASALVDLAEQLKDTDLTHIRFITTPNAAYAVGDPNWGRLYLLPQAKKLWKTVRDDEPLGKVFAAGSISANKPNGTKGGKSEDMTKYGLCN